jgi:RHS repeat-associated protein
MSHPTKSGCGRVAMLMAVVALSACAKSGRPSNQTSRQWPAAIAECDPAGYINCISDAASISIPVANTGLSLTYWSSPGGDTTTLGIGGWSIDAVQRVDKTRGILIDGHGRWHAAHGAALASGEIAFPSYDGAVGYVFDPAGHHVRTVDGYLGTVLLKIGYDAGGRLDRVDGLVGEQPVHVVVQHASDGTPQALIGTDGATTTLDLDRGRLTGITAPDRGRTQIAWSNGRVISTTNPLGSVTRYEYDQAGNLTSITDADSVLTRFERKDLSAGFEVRSVSALGRQWLYRAESADGGVRRTLVAPDGSTSTETVDGNGNRKITLPDGSEYTIGAVAGTRWGGDAPILTPVVAKRSDGSTSRREVRVALTPQQGLPFVVTGSVTTTINGQPWVETFDAAQRSATLVDPVGRRTTSTYDAAGHLLRRSAPGVAPVAYAYDSAGRTMSETAGTGALAASTRYRYDPSTGNIIVTRADGAVDTTEYDGTARAVSMSAGSGSTVLATYDAAGRLSLLLSPGGATYAFGTSAAGRPTAFIPPPVSTDSSIEFASYDRDGALAAITGLGARAVSIARDQAGRVTAVTFDRGKRSMSYDAHSALLTQAGDPSGLTTRYGYVGSSINRLEWSGPINGFVAETLDVNDRPVAEVVNGKKTWSFAYDRSGQLTGVGPLVLTRDPSSGLVSRTTLGAVETSQELDANGQIVHVTTRAGGKVVLDQRFTRDASGVIKTVVETLDGKTTTTEYSYDREGRLGSVRVDGRVEETASYDAAGNRVSVARPAGTVKAVYDDRDRLLGWGQLRYAWSSNGSLERRTDGSRAMSLRYDDFGSLRDATLADGRTLTFLVDAEGRRVGRQVGGKLADGFLYRPDGSLAAQLDSAGRVSSVFGYDDAGNLALVERSGVIYRIITDPIGSPRLVIDSRTGAVTDVVTYDAWGDPVRETMPAALPIGFAGGLRDPGTGLVLFGARDYDPTTGRWTAPDPIGFDAGDANLYRYAAGDPVNALDRSGLTPKGGGGGGGGKPKGNPNTGKPPSTGNPPTTSNPPTNGTPNDGFTNPPPGTKAPIWHCVSPRGGCLPPPGGGKWGCDQGECGNNGSGFSCKAVRCWGPSGDLCIGSVEVPCSYGEPHLRTGNGGTFDFQAVGEFLVASSSDGTFIVQVRQEPLYPQADVAINTAVAANVNGDRVGVYTKEPSFLVINGTPNNQAELLQRLPHGGTIRRHGVSVAIEWPDGSRLTTMQLGRLLNYAFEPSARVAPSLSGLVPSARRGGDRNSFVGRDNVALSAADADFPVKLYRQYGNSWRIRQPESLFYYWPGETTARFTDLEFPRKRVTAATLSADTRSRAERICRAVGAARQPTLDDCVLDVGVSGTPAMAAASVSAARSAVPSMAAAAPQVTMAAQPIAAANPSSPPPSADTYPIKIGDTVAADRPAPGAGRASPGHDKQTYSFASRGGEIVYVQVVACGGASLTFEVRDSSDHILGGKIGCGSFGPITLGPPGVYRVLVKADRAAVGGGGSPQYSFWLRSTSLDAYAIAIGDSISPDHPRRGAGVITQPGQQQSYTFQAAAGQAIYLQIGPCEGSGIALDVNAPDNSRVDGQLGCHDLGRVELAKAGTYHIVVRADGPAHYAFAARPIPHDQHFALHVPGQGAGRITAAGEQQFYDFSGRPGSVVHLEGKCAQPCPNLVVRVTKAGDSGERGFLDLMNMKQDWVLPAGTDFTIQVRSNGYRGGYAFTAGEAGKR